ncbi:DUF1566 domain-containing protein [Labrenzia suaedae]|uniref:DUF1566 domain-containing protein n=2 Tax=Roseibium litorale TaxID=2803841 RepID=A0ABR9CGZ2_9HYPH|nr:DUF1566 domain-containing protein [Roseibium litorale]
MSRFLSALAPVLAACATPASASCVSGPSGQFILKGEVAEDSQSGLIWKRCAVGMSWSADKQDCAGEPAWLDQEAAHKAASEAGAGWRVPTGAELDTLLLDTCDGPKIDTAAFPAISRSDFGEGAKFWTSSEALPGMFYFFEFMNGYADMHSAGYGLQVLLVRSN